MVSYLVGLSSQRASVSQNFRILFSSESKVFQDSSVYEAVQPLFRVEVSVLLSTLFFSIDVLVCYTVHETLSIFLQQNISNVSIRLLSVALIVQHSETYVLVSFFMVF